MKYRAHIFTFFLAFAMLIPSLSSVKENVDYTCYKRGVEIIYPYENAIFKIKKIFNNHPDKKKKNWSSLNEVLKKIFMVFHFTKKLDVLMLDYQNI